MVPAATRRRATEKRTDKGFGSVTPEQPAGDQQQPTNVREELVNLAKVRAERGLGSSDGHRQRQQGWAGA
jgi:hypothetical protein